MRHLTGAAAATGTPFPEGVELVAEAVGAAVDGSVAEVVRMMAAEQWIEAGVGPRKALAQNNPTHADSPCSVCDRCERPH